MNKSFRPEPPPPPPPPPRMMRSGLAGMCETAESKQATADWYKSIGRPPPVEYTDAGDITASYAFKRLAFLSFGVAFAIFMAYQ